MIRIKITENVTVSESSEQGKHYVDFAAINSNAPDVRLEIPYDRWEVVVYYDRCEIRDKDSD